MLQQLTSVSYVPKNPATRGPVTTSFSDQTGGVGACGEKEKSKNKECYIFLEASTPTNRELLDAYNTADKHIKGTWSVHSFNETIYLSLVHPGS